MYILNEVTSKVEIFGHALLPIFVRPETFQEIGGAWGGEPFSLNAGSFQLRLHQQFLMDGNVSSKSLRGWVFLSINPLIASIFTLYFHCWLTEDETILDIQPPGVQGHKRVQFP